MTSLKKNLNTIALALIAAAVVGGIVWPQKKTLVVAIGALGLLALAAHIAFNLKSLKQSFRRKSFIYSGNLLLIVVLVLAIIGLVNYFLSKNHYRMDFTTAKLHSLSDQSVTVLKNLKTDIAFKCFFREGNYGRAAMGNLLKIYAYHSGKVKYEFIDPDKNPGLLKRYEIAQDGTTVFECGDKDNRITTATEEDITGTVAVMGGEDWRLWIDALRREGLLASGAITVAYSYIGPALTSSIYREGTIGRAKEHLEATALSLDGELASTGGRALVAVNKAVVTLASAAIPCVPLYIALLYKVMKDYGTHEGCIQQMNRLFRDRLYAEGTIPVDEAGRIRLDELELDPAVQARVQELWDQATTENLPEIADFASYRSELSRICGFESPGVDYGADVNQHVNIPSL